MSWDRCRANVAHIRQSGPDSGHGFKAKVHKIFVVVPSSVGSGSPMGLFISFRESTPLQIVIFLFPIANRNMQLTVSGGG